MNYIIKVHSLMPNQYLHDQDIRKQSSSIIKHIEKFRTLINKGCYHINYIEN